MSKLFGSVRMVNKIEEITKLLKRIEFLKNNNLYGENQKAIVRQLQKELIHLLPKELRTELNLQDIDYIGDSRRLSDEEIKNDRKKEYERKLKELKEEYGY